MGTPEKRFVRYKATISTPAGMREYVIEIPVPPGVRIEDFHEHNENVLGSAIEMGCSLLDARFVVDQHRV